MRRRKIGKKGKWKGRIWGKKIVGDLSAQKDLTRLGRLQKRGTGEPFLQGSHQKRRKKKRGATNHKKEEREDEGSGFCPAGAPGSMN